MDELESQVYNVLVNLIDEDIRISFEIAEYNGLLIVDESYRNLKIGSKLLDHAKKRSIEKKCFKCTLVCGKNVATFYIKNNFEERGVNMSFLI